MADQKATALSAFTPILSDILYGVDDPGGTPVSGKVTLTAIRDLLQDNLEALTVATGTITTSTPALDATQTWNDGAVTFTGMKLNVTDTASAAGSKLLDLLVGGASQLSVAKDGAITMSPRSVGDLFLGDGTRTIKRGSIGDFAFNGRFEGTGFTILSNNNTDNIVVASGNGVFKRYILSGDLSGNSDTLDLRNGSNPHNLQLYNLAPDSSNYERVFHRWNTNVYEMGSEAAGTGTLRGILFGVSGNSIGFLGATPVAQQSTTGTTTGFTAGAGTAVNDDSTFTGNSGTAAYTIGDIVLALKNYGLMAAS